MDRRSRQPDDVLAGETRGELSPRVARALWRWSAGLVLAVPGVSVLVAGAGHGPRAAVAVGL
ncbi:sensor histidine kinase, partial [Streptomyces hayashii]